MAYLVINGIPLRDQHTINTTTLARARRGREIAQRTIELGQLVDSLISYKRFSNKDNFVWVVDRNELKGSLISAVEHHYVSSILCTFARARMRGYMKISVSNGEQTTN